MALLSGSEAADAENPPCPDATAPPDPKFTPCQRRVDQGQEVIKRIISQLDEKVDPSVRQKIMESCGRLCHDTATAGRKRVPTAEEAKGFLDYMKRNFQVEQTGDETVIHFKYTSNPRGLKPSEGYCLCPIFEVPPKDLSSAYCQCSVGYVTAIFEQGLGKPARIELKESVLRGGKGCSFEVRFKTA